jgi:hypothetical protein
MQEVALDPGSKGSAWLIRPAEVVKVSTLESKSRVEESTPAWWFAFS